MVAKDFTSSFRLSLFHPSFHLYPFRPSYRLCLFHPSFHLYLCPVKQSSTWVSAWSNNYPILQESPKVRTPFPADLLPLPFPFPADLLPLPFPFPADLLPLPIPLLSPPFPFPLLQIKYNNQNMRIVPKQNRILIGLSSSCNKSSEVCFTTTYDTVFWLIPFPLPHDLLLLVPLLLQAIGE